MNANHMYGREAELEKIESLLLGAGSEVSKGCLLVIDGAQQIGKTTLWQAAVRSAESAGFEVRTPPFWHAIWLLDKPGEQQSADDPQGPGERRRPVLVAIDDVPMKALTAASLAELAKRATRRGEFVLLTVNTEAAGHAAQDLFGTAIPGVKHMRLEPLRPDAIMTMVSGMLGHEPGPKLRRLLDEANGCPSLTKELVQGLMDDGLADGDPGPDDPLPSRVHATVQASMSRLSARAVHLIWVAAALGTSFCLSDVTFLMRETTAALLYALDEGLRSGVLVGERDKLSFRCGLYWHVVVRTIPPSVLDGLQTDIRGLLKAAPALPLQRGASTASRPLSAAPVPVARAPEDPVEEADRPSGNELTETERQIVRLVASGLTNRQVAKRLYLSPHTVNYHLRRIFRKLEVTSRVELARFVPV